MSQDSTLCHVCGNELDYIEACCPFCGEDQKSREPQSRPGFRHKKVNLEAGRPIVDIAIRKLINMVEIAINEQISVLTVIHGYGSSGKGGAIRVESRKLLDHMREQGKIRLLIPGERFEQRDSLVKDAVNRLPRLAKHADFGKRNPGITIVII